MAGPSIPSFPIPMVNGARFSWASIGIGVAGKKTIGCKAINYKDSLKPGKVRGTNAQVIGRTRGNYDADGSITFYREDFNDVLAYLATLSAATSSLSPSGLPPGFKEVAFDISVNFSETPISPVQTDFLRACRITDTEEDMAEGEDAVVVKCTLDSILCEWAKTSAVFGNYSINIPVGF